MRCDCNAVALSLTYLTAFSFRQLYLIIIVILAQSKSTPPVGLTIDAHMLAQLQYIDTQRRFDVVRATSKEAATANASHSLRQM